jgi:hypothetical protein
MADRLSQKDLVITHSDKPAHGGCTHTFRKDNKHWINLQNLVLNKLKLLGSEQWYYECLLSAITVSVRSVNCHHSTGNSEDMHQLFLTSARRRECLIVSSCRENSRQRVDLCESMCEQDTANDSDLRHDGLGSSVASIGREATRTANHAKRMKEVCAMFIE